MTMKTVFMFSGQGSHYFQMGREFYDNEPVFRKHIHEIDEIVKDIMGESVVDYIYSSEKKRSDVFDSLKFSHPAIFMVEYSIAKVLIEDRNIEPDLIIGASLGEFTGAALSKVIGLEDAEKLVINQCRIFEENCKKGAMIAVLDNHKMFYQEKILHENSEIASINYDLHFVISTELNSKERIETFLKDRNITYMVLPVDYGFHSSFINPAKNSFLELMNEITFMKPEIPVVSCATCDKVENFNGHFWDVVRKKIHFKKVIESLESGNNNFYIDLGPSGTLATFIKYQYKEKKNLEAHAVMPVLGKEIDCLNRTVDRLKRIKNKKNQEKKMLTYVFPGQGSQKKGMGKELFQKYPEITDKASEILGYRIDELSLNDPENKLGETQYTQPALFTVNALSYYDEVAKNGKPDYVAGHSLGEYNALLASEVIDFETGLKIVHKRGQLMAQAKGGGMAAVIGLSEEDINKILKENGYDSISIANYNSPTQIVIAGPKEDILNAKNKFDEARLYIPLNVSGAFHSSHMETAIEEFTSFISDLNFNPPKIPVISNLEARPYEEKNIKDNLIKQLTNPVKWVESICYLMGKGVTEFREVGPGKVLTGLIKNIEKEAEPLIVENENKKTKEESEVKEEIKQVEAEEEKEKGITAESLGNKSFKEEYNLKYAYLAGAMYRGIASTELVLKMADAGLMGFVGTGGMDLNWIENSIIEIKNKIKGNASFGMNLLNSPLEKDTVDLYLKHNINIVEAAAYIQVSPDLVRYRLNGLSKDGNGNIKIKNRIFAKVSRPEVAESFLSPPKERIIDKLIEENLITKEEAELSIMIPMADDICIEADSGGHTDQGVITTLYPSIKKLRDEMKERYGYSKNVRLGAAGGIGTPEAAAAAFILGADFILTGSVNQCTIEAGTSSVVKSMLQNMNVQDTDYAPAGDMFELGAKVQVLRKGVFFPARANKLYSLYQQYSSIEEIDENTKKQLEEKYFKKSFDEVYEECKKFYPKETIAEAERNSKLKMSLIMKWYFGYSTIAAIEGNESERVNFQIHCGPALGAFNQWVKGTELEDWKNRHVDKIAYKLMEETAQLLNERFKEMGL